MMQGKTPLDEIGSWGKELAAIWTNYPPPCRPSWGEMTIYSRYLRMQQNKRPGERLSLLILGSTSEFRDWGYQEFLDVTVIDFSTGYNRQIEWELRHKNIHERFVHERWQDMQFEDEFDLVVGDLVIGNLKETEVIPFLQNVERAVRPDGYFMTKSFFQRDGQGPKKELRSIFEEYLQGKAHLHPFSTCIYQIAESCVDPETDILAFRQMYDQIMQVYRDGVIDRRLSDIFGQLGWQSNMKFGFYMPPAATWERMAQCCFNIVAKEKSSDVYSEYFDVYVMTPKTADTDRNLGALV